LIHNLGHIANQEIIRLAGADPPPLPQQVDNQENRPPRILFGNIQQKVDQDWRQEGEDRHRRDR
jgi:hypothetical protein